MIVISTTFPHLNQFFPVPPILLSSSASLISIRADNLRWYYGPFNHHHHIHTHTLPYIRRQKVLLLHSSSWGFGVPLPTPPSVTWDRSCPCHPPPMIGSHVPSPSSCSAPNPMVSSPCLWQCYMLLICISASQTEGWRDTVPSNSITWKGCGLVCAC